MAKEKESDKVCCANGHWWYIRDQYAYYIDKITHVKFFLRVFCSGLTIYGFIPMIPTLLGEYTNGAKINMKYLRGKMSLHRNIRLPPSQYRDEIAIALGYAILQYLVSRVSGESLDLCECESVIVPIISTDLDAKVSRGGLARLVLRIVALAEEVPVDETDISTVLPQESVECPEDTLALCYRLEVVVRREEIAHVESLLRERRHIAHIIATQVVSRVEGARLAEHPLGAIDPDISPLASRAFEVGDEATIAAADIEYAGVGGCLVACPQSRERLIYLLPQERLSGL